MPITFKPLAALFLALGTTAVHAAELGDATVRSHVGQPLVADVELVDLTPQDLADLQARLASRDVFQGANVTMSPALAGLNVSIVKRDARRTLHLTTSAPVQAELLHLYFELFSAGRQSVRGVTLWLTPAPPAPPAPLPQPTRIVAAPPAPAPEPAVVAPAPESKRPAARAAGVSIQLAAAGVPGKQATRADAELLGAVERAFAARTAKPAPVVKAPVEEKHAAEPPAKDAAKVDKPAVTEKQADKPAPAKAEPKDKTAVSKPVEKVAEKPAEKLAVQRPEAKPAPAKPAQPVEDKAMLKKLAELEAKLKTLQKMVNSAPAATAAPVATAAAAATPAPGAPKAVEAPPLAPPAPPVVAAPGRSAAGKITDARSATEAQPKSEAHPAVSTVEEPAAAPPKVAESKAKAAEPKPAPAPLEEPAKDKKMSRPKVLTMIAGGSMALLAVLGAIIHFVRRRNARNAKAQIKVWQSWRKKAIAEAAVAEDEEGAEGTEAAAEAKAA